jgi:hypothetical protein
LPRWLGLIALTLSLAGCATSSAEAPAASGPLAQAARAEVEDDGLPPQAAPRAGVRDLADDPREPFSRNYGPPSDAWPRFPVRMSQLDEEALIATAIAAHEMRRP